MLQYNKGEVFRLAIYNPSKLAHRALCCLVLCMFSGPKLYILDSLPEMQASVSKDSIAALAYIAEYLTAKS